MDIVNEIVTWASTLPMWEQDAIRRIVRQQTLTERDLQETLLILKKEHGLVDSQTPVPPSIPATRTDFPAPTCPAAGVVLCSMHSLKNVNAIAEGQLIEFAAKGVTVIYGENASGKSGYSRVLKRACRARDEQERILPNVYECSKETPPAEAIFELKSDKKDTEVHWVDGQQSPDEMGSIAVFDAGCARVYIDEANEVVYTPYGLDLFPRLVDLCQRLKGQMESEIAALGTEPAAVSTLRGSTSVGRLIEGLGPDTELRTVEALATLSDEERRRIEELKVTVSKLQAEAPDIQAKRIRQFIARLERLKTKAASLHSSLSDEAIGVLKKTQQDTVNAETAARMASARIFDVEPLPGAGTEVWKAMFLAAKRYSEQYAYPEVAFPATASDARCVLCMQPLQQEARARLERFWRFIEEDTQKIAATKRQALDVAEREFGLIEADLDVREADIIQDLSDVDATSGGMVRSYLEAAKGRKSAVEKTVKDGQWNDIPELPSSPQECLARVLFSLDVKAKDLERMAQSSELRQLEAALRDLQARDALSHQKVSVLKYVAELKRRRLLETCRESTTTTGITRKRTELMERAVTSSLRDALGRELTCLGIRHFKLNIEGIGRSGATLVHLTLDNLRYGGANVSTILSEGEQRAVAIASFLAELGTGCATCAIVFDDPVCSLDHVWRERVARRLVREGSQRQVIIFTHDISFLRNIIDEATRQQIPLLPQCVTKLGSKSGIRSLDLPWESKKVGERVTELYGIAQQVQGIYEANNGDCPEYKEAVFRLYSRLRASWERIIEETLFANIVVRFRSSVETRRLDSVVVEDQDFAMIEREMTACSGMIDAHDQPPVTKSSSSPPELRAAIRKLEEYSYELRKRQDTVRKRRDTLRKPPPV